jgi:hypothetical protein
LTPICGVKSPRGSRSLRPAAFTRPSETAGTAIWPELNAARQGALAAPPGGAWDDFEQGWWASVRAVGDEVFMAETDLGRLCDVKGEPVPVLRRPGCVELSGAEVTWSRVPRAAWIDAWEAARTSCLRGEPAPRAPSSTAR